MKTPVRVIERAWIAGPLAVLLALAAAAAPGASRTWDGGGDGTSWYDASNWKPDGAPATSDVLKVSIGSAQTAGNVSCDGGGSITITGSSASASLGELAIGGSPSGAGTLGLLSVANGGRLTVAGALRVWGGSTAELNGGTIHTGSLLVAASEDANFFHVDGMLIVDGGVFAPDPVNYRIDPVTRRADVMVQLINGATASFSSDLDVGDYYTGSLEVLGGSQVTSAHGYTGRFLGSTGSAVVNGSESNWSTTAWMDVGTYGTGSLAVSNEATVSVGSFLTLGYNSTGDGEVTVDGATLHAASLYVGRDGHGGLTLTNGARFWGTHVYVAHNSLGDGTVSVDGAGTSFEASGSVYVGGSNTAAGGLARFTVGNGGEATVGGTLKAWAPGTVELLGGGIRCGSFVVVSGGTFTHTDGVLTVDGGAFAPATAGHTIAGDAPGKLATIELTNGAAAALAGDLDVGTAGGGGGALVLSNGGHVSVGGVLKVWQTGTLGGAGAVAGNVQNAGAIAPEGAGQIAIDGDAVWQAGGRLVVDVSGNDQVGLVISGAVAVSGALDLSAGGDMLVLNWQPGTSGPAGLFGGAYDVLIYTAGQRAGEFSQIIGGNFASSYIAGWQYDADLGGGQMSLRVTLNYLLAGDADLDGEVTRDDLMALVSGFGSHGANWSGGDFNLDGQVDTHDYIILKQNFGQLPQSHMPDPTTLGLLAIGGLAVLRRRRAK